MEGVKRVLTTYTTGSGMIFLNFPAYVHDGETEQVYLQRDLAHAETIEGSIPESYRQALLVNCQMIDMFQQELPDVQTTEEEQKILKSLSNTFPDWKGQGNS